MFGTFVPENGEDHPHYGIVKNLGTFNPLKIAVHEYIGILKDQFQKGLTLKDRFFYFFARPGWSHDHSRDDSQKLKASYVRQHPEQAGQPGLCTMEESRKILTRSSNS